MGKLYIVVISLLVNFLFLKWISCFKGEYLDVDVEIIIVNLIEVIS